MSAINFLSGLGRFLEILLEKVVQVDFITFYYNYL